MPNAMSINKRPRVLVLGVTGMLGSTIYRVLSADKNLCVFGTLRSQSGKQFFNPEIQELLISDIYVDRETSILNALSFSKPDVVINCIGIIKQLPNAFDYLESIAINATLPHRLAKYCRAIGARLIHFSTDCVFSGAAGNYVEQDFSDADDLYGRTKYLGELNDDHTLTLRTSIIGHELNSSRSLINWFLRQEGTINGYQHAIFSGLPTVEVAHVLKDYVLNRKHLHGLYHLSVEPISKYELLKLVSKIYQKQIVINAEDKFRIDRSLDSSRFKKDTGYVAKSWPQLIQEMHDDYCIFHNCTN
jgi:dTDP-4-dehydrorhamnose reductase